MAQVNDDPVWITMGGIRLVSVTDYEEDLGCGSCALYNQTDDSCQQRELKPRVDCVTGWHHYEVAQRD